MSYELSAGVGVGVLGMRGKKGNESGVVMFLLRNNFATFKNAFATPRIRIRYFHQLSSER